MDRTLMKEVLQEVSHTGVLIKASYQQSTAACGTSYRRLFGFH